MIKHVQVHDINGIKKIKLRFSIIKEETQYYCINEIQYLYINSTGCVCNVFFLSSLNVIKCHSTNNIEQPRRLHVRYFLEHTKQTKDFVK